MNLRYWEQQVSDRVMRLVDALGNVLMLATLAAALLIILLLIISG